MRTLSLVATVFLIVSNLFLVRQTLAQSPEIYPQLGFKTSGVYSENMVFSDDGNLLAAISGDKAIKIWDTTVGRELQTIGGEGHADKINSLALFPDNQRVVSGGFDKIAIVWDIATGKQLLRLTGHTDWVRSVVVSKDGKLIATSDTKAARLWDSRSGRLLVTVKAPEGEHIPGLMPTIRTLAISPDATQLILITNLEIFIYDIRLRQITSSAHLATTGIYTAQRVFGVSESGDLILGGGTEITFVALNGLRVTRKIEKEGLMLSYISTDGSTVVGHSTNDYKTMQNFDATTMRERFRYNFELDNPAIEYSRARKIAAVSDIHNHLKLFDLETGTELFDFSTHTFVPNSASFAKDASGIALEFTMPDTTKNRDFYKKIWSLKTADVETSYNLTERRELFRKLFDSGDPNKIETALNMNKMDERFENNAFRGGDTSEYDESDGCFYRVEWASVPFGLGNGSPLVNMYMIAAKDRDDYFSTLVENRKNWKLIKQFKAHDQHVSAVAVSFKRGYIFTGSKDMNIHLFSYPGTQLIRTFKGHLGAITSLTLSPDGTKLLSQAEDYTTRLWDVSSGKELARFLNFIDGEWIAITPEGYYNASPNADKHLNVRIGSKVYGIENYRETFFRPDLVKLALSGGSLQGYRTLADVKQPPKITIVQTPASTSRQEFKLTLRLEEQGGGIGDVRLFLNGSAVMLDSGRSLKAVKKDGSGAVFRNYSLKLSPGSNTIRAVAFNADNSMQSNEAMHQVSASFASSHKPALHALVVGINSYKNPKLTLQYAVADAQLFADTLKKSASGMFDKVVIKTLTTRAATSAENIAHELKMLRTINPDDLFVLYVASHGVVDDGEYYLITSNVGLTRTEKLKTDALTQTVLKELIANIPTTKKLIILDTCNAGAAGDAIQTAMLTRGMSEDTAMKILSRAVGSTILSAATSSQEALEGYQGHGLFTWVLSEGLKGKADKAKSGYVKTTDIADYVGEEVPNLAEKVFKRAQYPTISMNGQPFPVGKVGR